MVAEQSSDWVRGLGVWPQGALRGHFGVGQAEREQVLGQAGPIMPCNGSGIGYPDTSGGVELGTLGVGFRASASFVAEMRLSN